MSTFLKLLPLELSSIADNDIVEPTSQVEEGDHIIGDMSNSVKQLFTLGRMLEKDAKQNMLDCQYCTDTVKKQELEAKATELEAKSLIISLLMWISIRDELGIWTEDIGIRCGFRVVVTKEKEDDLPPFLRRLMGGG